MYSLAGKAGIVKEQHSSNKPLYCIGTVNYAVKKIVYSYTIPWTLLSHTLSILLFSSGVKMYSDDEQDILLPQRLRMDVAFSCSERSSEKMGMIT